MMMTVLCAAAACQLVWSVSCVCVGFHFTVVTRETIAYLSASYRDSESRCSVAQLLGDVVKPKRRYERHDSLLSFYPSAAFSKRLNSNLGGKPWPK
jgi:hypothetical protein